MAIICKISSRGMDENEEGWGEEGTWVRTEENLV